MTPGTPTTTAPAVWDYVESYLGEDEVLQAARARGVELGCTPIGPGGGAALRFLAAALRARAVVEVGTGCGVSGLWLLRGMAPDGVLTSIDVEPEHQRVAKRAFTEAGVAPSRARLIMGQPLDVLPRLTDGGYDMVFVAYGVTEYPRYLQAGVRLLRDGGVIVFDDALWHGRVADPTHRDAETVAVREISRAMREEENLVPALLPVGNGLLAAAKLG
ncbi:O-methyltransferase [Longimycelium tulufanense]|uniref:O-methyltransferase n=1 Tax=Longimycelium tulufanense TaxID=907463 RepID=UPI001E4B9024|nr:O-methyltransferase [Longimycelium tulufanense]